jgi:hypothetical protein
MLMTGHNGTRQHPAMGFVSRKHPSISANNGSGIGNKV